MRLDPIPAEYALEGRKLHPSKKICSAPATVLTTEINKLRENPMSVDTVKRRLWAANLNGRILARKPLLRPANKKKRLAWAKIHKDWTQQASSIKTGVRLTSDQETEVNVLFSWKGGSHLQVYLLE
ncbi:hypothetical protein C0J52_18241 [Blattella germanica]|nr:hypothetical protein C0J52_18241 [Blattella germanica]